MAVVKWVPSDTRIEPIGPRNFPPPKRADLRNWYKAAQKALNNKSIPSWEENYRTKRTVDETTIIFELSTGTLYISRKRYL